MSTADGPLKGVAQWDNVKLMEVWREFLWHCQLSGRPRSYYLSDYDRRVRDQLVSEMVKRDISLPSF